MMKTLARFILTDFWVFPLSAGTKTISRIILVSVCAALLFSPSLCVLFFCCSAFMLCFFLCYLLSFICSLRPVSPHGSALFLSPRGRLCPAFIKPAAVSVVVTAGLLNAL
ncbi:hypothetical protein Peur_014882 [Populus x canadensis]